MQMKMQFSVGLGRNEAIYEIGKLAHAAEESGFSHITFVDQPNLSRDVHAMMTVAAVTTRQIRIGQGVTDPLTTDLSVIANATATVNELSGGRVFLGLGAGGPLGKTSRPAKTEELREAIGFIRTYMEGKEAEIRGAQIHSEWISDSVPIYLAAEGARTLALVGEMADGVILGGSIHPQVVQAKIDIIRQSAHLAGRDLGQIDIWMRTMICMAETKEAVYDDVAGQAVTKCRGMYHVLKRETPATIHLRSLINMVEPGLIDEMRHIYESWDPYQHEMRNASINRLVSQRLIDFFFLTGQVDDICARIVELGQLGVRNISIVTFTVNDKKGLLKAVGEKIIPRFQG